MTIELKKEIEKTIKAIDHYNSLECPLSDDISYDLANIEERKLEYLKGLICDFCHEGKISGRVTMNMTSPPEDVDCPVCHGTGVK